VSLTNSVNSERKAMTATDQVNSITETIEALFADAEGLEKRLDPILRPDGPRAVGKEEEDGEHSTFLSHLRLIGGQLAVLRERLFRIRDRIEL